MSTTAPNLSADITLNLVNDDVSSYPDKIRVVFTPTLIATIARALAGIHLMDVGFGAEVRVSVGDCWELFDCDEPWDADEKESSSGDFIASSFWLKVDDRSISIEIWDKYGDAELHGDEPFTNIPGLTEALENAKADAIAALRARLV